MQEGLSSLDLRELRERAQAAGADAQAIEDARDDEDDPKAALIARRGG